MTQYCVHGLIDQANVIQLVALLAFRTTRELKNGYVASVSGAPEASLNLGCKC